MLLSSVDSFGSFLVLLMSCFWCASQRSNPSQICVLPLVSSNWIWQLKNQITFVSWQGAIETDLWWQFMIWRFKPWQTLTAVSVLCISVKARRLWILTGASLLQTAWTLRWPSSYLLNHLTPHDRAAVWFLTAAGFEYTSEVKLRECSDCRWQWKEKTRSIHHWPAHKHTLTPTGMVWKSRSSKICAKHTGNLVLKSLVFLKVLQRR